METTQTIDLNASAIRWFEAILPKMTENQTAKLIIAATAMNQEQKTAEHEVSQS